MFKGRPLRTAYSRLPAGKMTYEPALEWFFACRWWGIDWAVWAALDADEQARRIAVYRVEAQMRAVESWEQARRHEEAARRRR